MVVVIEQDQVSPPVASGERRTRAADRHKSPHRASPSVFLSLCSFCVLEYLPLTAEVYLQIHGICMESAGPLSTERYALFHCSIY